MEIYIVKRLEGKDSASIMKFDELGFTSLDKAEEYAAAKNKKMNDLSVIYNAVKDEAYELLNNLFVEYIKTANHDFYEKLVGDASKGETEEEIAEFWEKHREFFDEFVLNSTAVEFAMSKVCTPLDLKEKVRRYMDYVSYVDGLPYFYAAKTPIRVINTESI